MQELAADYAMSLITAKLDEAFGSLARSTRRNKFVKLHISLAVGLRSKITLLVRVKNGKRTLLAKSAEQDTV